MNILIVDDNATNCKALSMLLQKVGYDTLIANNGPDAIELFRQHSIDLILMDVMMPGMDGYETTRRIKALGSDKFVPVIFVTAVTDTDALVRCIEAGGDDFLTKPYNAHILRAKITAMQRISELHRTLRWQKKELGQHKQRLHREIDIASSLYSKILHRGNLDSLPINYWLSPQSFFCGDILLAARTPTGRTRIMLGDFTGHGLPAALGAIPVSQTFYHMTEKSVALEEVIAEVNNHLLDVLPLDMFCAAVFLELDPANNQMQTWNGGMPPIYVKHGDKGIDQRIESRCPALGIVDTERLDTSLLEVDLTADSTIYLLSDGLTDLKNAAGEKLGAAAVEHLIGEKKGDGSNIEYIRSEALSHWDPARIHDDVSLVEITVCDQRDEARCQGSQPPTFWGIDLHLDSDTLKASNPVPLLLDFALTLRNDHTHRQQLYTVISELFSNALDHGLLELDSSMKDGPEGFVEYFQERTRRLNDLTEGWVYISLSHCQCANNGRLAVTVKDSGKGFDVAQVKQDIASNQGYKGRGLQLVENLCESFTFNDEGNCVTANFHWQRD